MYDYRMTGYNDDSTILCPGPDDADPDTNGKDEHYLYGRSAGCPAPEDDDGGQK